MLLLGFELEDVARVAIGTALVLLTIYRRELSCNRGYHPASEDGAEAISLSRSGDDFLRESDRRRRLFDAGVSYRGADGSSPSREDVRDGDGDDDGTPSRLVRRASTPALPSLSMTREEDLNNADEARGEDPTGELLESAGLLLSGGPFLAMAKIIFGGTAIAMFDHVISMRVVRALIALFRPFTERNGYGQYPGEDDASECTDGTNDEAGLHSVAWNAASEYFVSISDKIDGGLSPQGLRERDGNNKPARRLTEHQSTGNLQRHVSAELARELMGEMVAMARRGGFDVTLLPSDAQVDIFSYLHPRDVLEFACTNKAGRALLEDNEEVLRSLNGGKQDVGQDDYLGIYGSSTDTATLIWKALFQRDYSWVLTDWKIGREAFLRSMKTRQSSAHGQHLQLPQQQQRGAKSHKVFRHLVSAILDSEDNRNAPLIEEIMEAATSSASIHPTSSMKDFYFSFVETWLNYTIAGCNTTDKCFIGLHGHVVNISDFPFCNSLNRKRSIVNFYMPSKRSRPRSFGGLQRVRDRIKREEESQTNDALVWETESLGTGNLFGGVRVYYDPFCGWRWWYTDRDFNAVYTGPPS
ncbi:hypothetical protein ACHAWF_016543 [Thalassiosira exigua]